MKQVQIQLINGVTSIEQSFEVHKQTGLKKVLGSALNRIFEFSDLLRSVNSESIIKANDNLACIISVNGTVEIDTYKINESIGAKLSFGPSSKSKKRFAERLYKLIQWSMTDVKVIDVETLINSLD